MADSDNLISEQDKIFWENLEKELNISLPLYIKNLLSLTGFNTKLALNNISERDFDYIEKFTREELPLILTEKTSDFYHIYYKIPDKFKLVNGHRILLSSMGQLLKNKENSVNTNEKSVKAMPVSNKRKSTAKLNTPEIKKSKTTLPVDDRINLSKLVNKWLAKFCEQYEGKEINDKILEIIKVIRKNVSSVSITLDMQNQNSSDIASTSATTSLSKISEVAYIGCPVCEKSQKVQKCPQSNGQLNWVLSNYNRHIRSHIKDKLSTQSDPKSANLSQPLITTLLNMVPPVQASVPETVANNIVLSEILSESENSCLSLSDYSYELYPDISAEISNNQDFCMSKISVEATNACIDIKASNQTCNSSSTLKLNSLDSSKLKFKTNKWKQDKYSRTERAKRKRNSMILNNQSTITEYFSILNEIEIVLNENNKLKTLLYNWKANENNYTLLQNTLQQNDNFNVINLLKLTATKNDNRKNSGNRFENNLKLFSTYLFLIGGRLLYETLQANMKNALPSVNTIQRTIQSCDIMREGELRFKELHRFLTKRNLPLHVWISEDQTAIKNDIQYDSNTNNLLGFVSPLGTNGLPIIDYFQAKSAKHIEHHFQNSSKASYVNVILAQPLVKDAPSFTLCIYGSDNKFNANDVMNRWKYLEFTAAKHGIKIEGFSSDGDTRLLKCMKLRSSLPISTSTNKWFQIKENLDDPVCIQDTVHIGTKLKTKLLKRENILQMGKYQVTIEHVYKLLEIVSKDKHLIAESDLLSTDKMNFESIQKLSQTNIQNLLTENIKESNATVVYLKITRLILDAFLCKELTVLIRLYNIWYAVFFLRIWRHWLLKNKYNITNNFITLNSYTCIELNAHALVILCEKYKQNDTQHFYMPWLMSSQPCEQLFRAARSMTTTFSTIINFSVLDFLRRTNRIQLINEIMAEIGIKSDGDFSFPREEKTSRLGKGYNSDISLPAKDEIEKEIAKAMKDALELAESLGMCVNKYDEDWLKVSIKEGTSSMQEGADQASNSLVLHSHSDEDLGSQNNEEKISITIEDNNMKLSNNIKDLQLKDYSKNIPGGTINENDPFVQIQLDDGKIKIIKKSTLCWFLYSKGSRLSTDRIHRFKRSDKTISATTASTKKKNTQTTIVSSSEEETHISLGSDTLTEDFSTTDDERDSLNLELEKYFAVYYFQAWYIGRIIKIGESTVTIKFLKNNLDEYVWPKSDDIQTVSKNYVFHGPICLIGNEPFKLKRNDLLNIRNKYKKLKQNLN